MIKREIRPTKDKYGRFINLSNKVDRLYYNIFFNDNEEEIINKYEIKKENKVERIKIIIDFQGKSFKNLFYEYTCIESINFKNFYRNSENVFLYLYPLLTFILNILFIFILIIINLIKNISIY